MKSLHDENIFELLQLLLRSNALKMFFSIRMRYTSYTHKFSNITYFLYYKRLVVPFMIFRNARELYKFMKGPERVAKQTTTHLNHSEDTEVKVIEKGDGEEVTSTLKKTNTCIKLLSY